MSRPVLNQNLHFNENPKWFVCPLKLEKHFLMEILTASVPTPPYSIQAWAQTHFLTMESLASTTDKIIETTWSELLQLSSCLPEELSLYLHFHLLLTHILPLAQQMFLFKLLILLPLSFISNLPINLLFLCLRFPFVQSPKNCSLSSSMGRLFPVLKIFPWSSSSVSSLLFRMTEA